MKIYHTIVFSSLFLASCGLDSMKSVSSEAGSTGGQGSDVVDKADKVDSGHSDSLAVDRGSLEFDLSGVQLDEESVDAGLALTGAAEPAPVPSAVPSVPGQPGAPEPLPSAPVGARFDFTLRGAGWGKAVSFPFGQKLIVIGELPVGKVEVELKLVGSRNNVTKSASGTALIEKAQKTNLTLVLQKVQHTDGTGSLDVTVIDAPSVHCGRELQPLPSCALPFGVTPSNQVCSVTISGKTYTQVVNWCASQARFSNWMCSQGIDLSKSESKVTCKEEDIKVCTKIAGHLYSKHDASAIAFTDGCQRDELLKSGKAVPLSAIPALFDKGDVQICTQAIVKMMHTVTKEIIEVGNGCVASGLPRSMFTPVK